VNKVLSPRAPVAMAKVAVRTMAALRVAEADALGVFIEPFLSLSGWSRRQTQVTVKRSRCGYSHKLEWSDQVGIGMAVAPLIDKTANAKERQIAKAAIASEAATALVRRVEARRATRPPNPPLVPCDRIVLNPSRMGESLNSATIFHRAWAGLGRPSIQRCPKQGGTARQRFSRSPTEGRAATRPGSRGSGPGGDACGGIS
jgi:hypothetical protein